MDDRFSVFHFDPVKEILKIRCHIYILVKKVIILRNIHVEMKSFAPPQKETQHTRLSCRLITYSIRIGNLDWRKCHKQPDFFWELIPGFDLSKIKKNVWSPLTPSLGAFRISWQPCFSTRTVSRSDIFGQRTIVVGEEMFENLYHIASSSPANQQWYIQSFQPS